MKKSGYIRTGHFTAHFHIDNEDKDGFAPIHSYDMDSSYDPVRKYNLGINGAGDIIFPKHYNNKTVFILMFCTFLNSDLYKKIEEILKGDIKYFEESVYILTTAYPLSLGNAPKEVREFDHPITRKILKSRLNQEQIEALLKEL